MPDTITDNASPDATEAWVALPVGPSTINALVMLVILLFVLFVGSHYVWRSSNERLAKAHAEELSQCVNDLNRRMPELLEHMKEIRANQSNLRARHYQATVFLGGTDATKRAGYSTSEHVDK